MRIPNIGKGDISVRNIYELMPFDNILIIQELPGSVLLELADKISSEGGWPVSSGIVIKIKNGKFSSISINSIPIDPEKIYRVAHNDYLANGGEECNMLIPFEQENYNLLIRDAVIAHIKKDTEDGHSQSSKIEGRIINLK